ELEKFVRYIKEKKESKESKEAKFSDIEIEHLEITDAEVKFASGASLGSKRFIVDFIDADSKEEIALNLSGLINLQNNEIKIEGRIKPFLNQPTGEIKLRAHQLNSDVFSDVLQLSDRVDLVLTLSFQISDKINSKGVVDITPTEGDEKYGSPFFGKLKYDVSIDEITGTAFVNSLSLNLFNLIHLSFVGTVEKLLEEAIFNLEGEGERIQLEKLDEISKLFPIISHIKASGVIDPSDIKVAGSIRKKDVKLSGRVALNGVDIEDSKYGFKASGLEGVFDFRNSFYGNTTQGFDAKGTLSLSKASANVLNIDNLSAMVELTSSGKGITLKSNGLYWKDSSISGVKSGNGKLKRLVFNLGENEDWDLSISSDGAGLRILDNGIYLKQYQVEIGSNGKSNINGNFTGKDAGYKNVAFPKVYSDINLSNNLLTFTNIKLDIRNYGELRVKNLNIDLNHEDNAPYKLEFTQGEFKGFNKNVESKGIGGEFVFYRDDKKLRWNGNLKISESNFYKSNLTNLSFKIKPSSDTIALENISGRFLGGNLKGNASIKGVKSTNLLSSEIEVENAVIPLDKFTLSLGKASIEYKGELGQGHLPEGRGTVKLSDLKVGKDHETFSVSSQLELKTVGETFIIENGFIEDKGRAKIPFSVRIDNSLNENRILHINIPDIPLAVAYKIVAPLLPKVISDGEFRGNGSLSLTSSLFLQEKNSFEGRLSIRDASFVGKYNGNYFYINGINGAVSLKDNIKPENTLASLMGESIKLDKKVLRGFIDTVTPDYLNKEGEFLSVREAEYGFLRLDNIECEVEINKSEINLKRFEASFYKGKVFGTGLLDYDGGDPKYSISLVFKRVSLKGISDSISSIKDYITGRINGIVWITGNGVQLDALNGPFRFWDVDSKDEQRRIGEAFLKHLGAREKFFFGTSHKYDNAVLFGYVKDGVITFKELDISYTIFGFKLLSVKVDERRNSISASHFLSVIREMAKRAGEGKVKIEFEN
ncbi:MAG TPA: hypothetical protein VH878_02895, partial [Thermodesulfobacteriota bacterium]